MYISPSIFMAQVIIGWAEKKVKLDKILRSNQGEFRALYGRRRVGKTFLIRQYFIPTVF